LRLKSKEKRVGRSRTKNHKKINLGFRRGGATAPAGKPPPEPTLPPPEEMKIRRNLHVEPRKNKNIHEREERKRMREESKREKRIYK